MVPVEADASPVPSGAVVSDRPAVLRAGIGSVPVDHQRCRRTPIRYPRSECRAPVHEVPVDVVVPTPGPVDARIVLDPLLISVDIANDLHLVAGGQDLVAQRLWSIVTRLRGGVGRCRRGGGSLIVVVDVGVANERALSPMRTRSCRLIRVRLTTAPRRPDGQTQPEASQPGSGAPKGLTPPRARERLGRGRRRALAHAASHQRLSACEQYSGRVRRARRSRAVSFEPLPASQKESSGGHRIEHGNSVGGLHRNINSRLRRLGLRSIHLTP